MHARGAAIRRRRPIRCPARRGAAATVRRRRRRAAIPTRSLAAHRFCRSGSARAAGGVPPSVSVQTRRGEVPRRGGHDGGLRVEVELAGDLQRPGRVRLGGQRRRAAPPSPPRCAAAAARRVRPRPGCGSTSPPERRGRRRHQVHGVRFGAARGEPARGTRCAADRSRPRDDDDVRAHQDLAWATRSCSRTHASTGGGRRVFGQRDQRRRAVDRAPSPRRGASPPGRRRPAARGRSC